MSREQNAIVRSAAACLFLLTPLLASAQIENDRENYYGDRIQTAVDMKATGPGGAEVCIPARTGMVVVGQDDKGLYAKLGSKGIKDCKSKADLSDSTAYVIAFDDLRRSGTTRTGATYGMLVVPFKYQTSGKKDFTGSASVGGYLGYRFETLRNLGMTATPILFMGASNVAVPNSATSTSDNVMGFSYGLGLVGTFKNAFQAGVVVGWDRVGNGVGYQYNGKPWVALEIGFAFLQ